MLFRLRSKIRGWQLQTALHHSLPLTKGHREWGGEGGNGICGVGMGQEWGLWGGNGVVGWGGGQWGRNEGCGVGRGVYRVREWGGEGGCGVGMGAVGWEWGRDGGCGVGKGEVG